MVINDSVTQTGAEVNSQRELHTKAIVESRAARESDENSDAYVVTCTDAGPVAAEYTIYLQNNSATKKLVIDKIILDQTDADVVWKIAHVTGTSAGTALSGINLKLGAANATSITARGGAAGVTGLTPSNVIHQFRGGAALASHEVDFGGALMLGEDVAIAIEYDAGTGGAVNISIFFHYNQI